VGFAATYVVSSGTLDVAIVIDLVLVVFAAIGVYRSSERHRAITGTTPWRLPSWLWVVLVVVLFPWTLLLYLLAWSTSRRRSGMSGSWRSGPGYPPGPGYGPGPGYPPGPGYGPGPGYPPEPGAPLPGGVQPEDPLAPAGPAVDRSGLPLPPNLSPGWYVDPTERFFLRYWDGRQWTERVASGGVESTDPPNGASSGG